MKSSSASLPALAALLLAGCFGQSLPDSADPQEPRDLSVELAGATADDLFAMAAADWDVPRDLLAAIAWKQSAFAPGDHDHDEHEPAAGWMGLTLSQIEVAVAATGYDAEVIADDRVANIFAGAAVLDSMRDEIAPWAHRTTADGSWWEVLVEWNDWDQEWMRHDWAMDVYRILQDGFVVPTLNGDIVKVDSRELPDLQDVRYVLPPDAGAGSFSGNVGYPGRARFVPAHSSNQSSRSGGTGAINRVVIHTTEGSYNGAISWFQNSSSNVSAHYVLRKSDGQVTQMVSDDRKAWHACSNNNDTIGIEHEGASANPATWTNAMFDSSARLTAWLVVQYDIPIDRSHIVGHGEIQPSSCSYRSDPGPHFDWDGYLAKVQAYAFGSSSAAEPEPLPEDPTLPGIPPVDLPRPEVSFQSPRNGDTVANPVIMRIASKDVHHTELWAGPYRIARDLVANPVNVGVLFHQIGERSVTAKGLSSSGAVLTSETITINIANVAGKLQPKGQQLAGMTWELESDVVSGAAPDIVKYYVDGHLLTDTGTGAQYGYGDGYPLQYTFDSAGTGRMLQARGYDDDGELVAEGFSYIDVENSAASSGSIIDVITLEVSGTVMRLQTEASADVAYVEYRVDGHLLTDMMDGDSKAYPGEYELWYRFASWGDRTLEVRGYDVAGNLVDVHTQTVHVPSPTLQLSWSPVTAMVFHFEAEAPAHTHRVVIDVEGYVLSDVNSGDDFMSAPDFEMTYRWNYAAYRAIRAQALDIHGNVLGTWTGMISSY